MRRIKKAISLSLTIVILLSCFTFNSFTVKATGWLDYAQDMVLGTAYTDAVTTADYAELGHGLYWSVYKFDMPANGNLRIYVESAVNNYFNYPLQTWNPGYYIINADTPDTVTWYDKNASIYNEKYSSSRGVYYGSTEIALSKGTYFFCLKDSLRTDQYQFTLSFVEPSVNVSSITLNKSALQLVIGESYNLTAKVIPTNATDSTIKWSSSKKSVATVKNGVITAVSSGKATITATSSDGVVKATCNVTVAKPFVKVSSLTLSSKSVTLEVGESKSITPAVSPDDATNPTITWSSSDKSVAEFKNGKVVAKKAGTAVITAQSSNKSIKKTCKVTVTKKVTNAQINKVKSSKVVISSVTGGKKKFSLKIQKEIPNASGYEILYKKGSSWKSVKTTTKTTAVTNLAKGKYQVKIRAYINKKNKTYFGKWSDVKQVAVK